MRIWAGSCHHHLPEKIRNTFFLAQVVNAFSLCIPHLWLFSLLGVCCDRNMFFVLCFIHRFLQMCFSEFVNESFSFAWSRENLQIMVYIPAQNRAKIQIASWVCQTIWRIFIKASKLECQSFGSWPKFVIHHIVGNKPLFPVLAYSSGCCFIEKTKDVNIFIFFCMLYNILCYTCTYTSISDKHNY